MTNRVTRPISKYTGRNIVQRPMPDVPPNPEEIDTPMGHKVRLPIPDQPALPAKGGSNRAFTDNPDLVGTEAAPGVMWEYVGDASKPRTDIVPQRPGGQEYKGELTGGMARGPIKEGVDMVGALEKVAELESKVKPPGAKPGEGTKLANYTAEGREQFRQQIINDEFGGIDPTTINPFQVLEDVEQNKMPEFFDQFFQGKRLYEDWEKGLLSKEENDAWMDRYKEIRARIFNTAKQKRQFGEQMLDEMMSRWDAQANAYFQELERVKKTGQAVVKSVREQKKEKRKSQEHGVKMAKDVANSERTVRADLQEAETPTGEKYRKTGKIPASDLRQLNSVRKAAGMPALKEFEKDGKFTYGEVGGKTAAQAQSNYVTDLTPDEETQLKQQFPNAMQDAQGRWIVPNAQGEYVFITR